MLLDIKGEQVETGDKVLVSTKRHGLVLTTLCRETKAAFYFAADSAERISKIIKGEYVGYQILNLVGQVWDNSRDGTYKYNPSNFTVKNLGNNNTRYKLQDVSTGKQSRVLKVDDNFTL